MTFSTYVAIRVHLAHSRVAVMALCTFIQEIRLLHSFDKATSAYLMKQTFKVSISMTIAATGLMQVIMAEFVFNDANERFKSQFLFDKGIYLDIATF